MAQPRHLTRPPIKEALIDIRVAPDTPVTSERLAPLRSALADRYPVVDERQNIQAELRVEGGKLMPRSQSAFGGIWFKTADDQQIAQFRPDGFTLNQVMTYVDGGVLVDEALRLWELYKSVAGQLVVTRLAMRYINELQLPYRPEDDFRRFLTEPARLPEDGSPQQFSSYLTRVVAHEGPDVIVVTQSLDSPGDDKGRVKVVVDLDVATTEDLSADHSVLMSALLRLRTLKNRVFFSLLTEEAVELFL